MAVTATMAAFHAHGPLVAFLHDLDTNTAAGATKEFLAALGRKLVVAQLIPEEEFAIEKTIETALSHNQIGTEPRSLSYCNKLFPITLFRSLLPSARTGSALHN